MDKYNNFINDLQKEVDKLEVVDVKDKVKSSYNPSDIKKEPSHTFAPKRLVLASFCLIILILCFILIKPLDNPVVNPIKPIIASSVDEAYAFEMMAAANYLYTDSNTSVQRKRQKNSGLNSICDKINDHYLTINQLLRKEKVVYEITSSDNSLYENKMVINSFFNSDFDLYYTIYFNKEFIEKDDEEEIYNLKGIIIINNTIYEIIGETVTDSDEIETKIKVIISNTEYLIIEQEKENDEEEFVYKTFVNNKMVKEFVISYEIEHNEIEIKLELNTLSTNEEVKAKFKNNEVFLEIEFDNYEGEIKVTDNNDSISYYFIDEKVTINKKIIK